MILYDWVTIAQRKIIIRVWDEGPWATQVFLGNWGSLLKARPFSLSQRKYVLELLQETWKFGFKPASVLNEENHIISFEEESDNVYKGKY